jgi:hypothetical protein
VVLGCGVVQMPGLGVGGGVVLNVYSKLTLEEEYTAGGRVLCVCGGGGVFCRCHGVGVGGGEGSAVDLGGID